MEVLDIILYSAHAQMCNHVLIRVVILFYFILFYTLIQTKLCYFSSFQMPIHHQYAWVNVGVTPPMKVGKPD
jgi:hypothetical protein